VTSPFHFGCKEWTFAALCLGVEGTGLCIDPSVRSLYPPRKHPRGTALSCHGILRLRLYRRCHWLRHVPLRPRICNSWLQETGRELLTALTMRRLRRNLKIGFGRYRPYTNKGAATFNPFSINEASASLPSGHTTTAFTVSSFWQNGSIIRMFPAVYMRWRFFTGASGFTATTIGSAMLSWGRYWGPLSAGPSVITMLPNRKRVPHYIGK